MALKDIIGSKLGFGAAPLGTCSGTSPRTKH